MRLIDADTLIEKINEIYKGYMTDESGCVPYDFEKIVDEQPTVYNVDKVVEELLQCTVCNGHKDHENKCGGCAGCIECKLEDAYYNAIDIVKGQIK